MIPVSSGDFLAVLPETILVLTALVIIMVDALRRRTPYSLLAGLALTGLTVSGITAATLWGARGTAFAGSVFDDGLGSFFKIVFCVIGALTVMYSPHYLRLRRIRLGEFFALLLIALFGMTVMVTAADLLVFFLGLETMSISLYVLAGLKRGDPKSSEAGMKYLVLGGFSSAFVLYGIALVYGTAGSVNYLQIRAYLAADYELGAMMIAGVGLLLVGFAFKVSAVPFHFWSPDVYEGAPTVITGFMSTGPKAAAFVALIRLFGVTLAPASPLWTDALTWIAILTMTVGNVVALRQTSVKRMLAYSSIAHAGYLLVGIVARTPAAFAATGYYLAAYALMNLGAFACLILLNRKADGRYSYEDLRGLGFGHPLLGASLTIFLLSLTGIPPTAGFFGKLYVFSAAIEQGHLMLAIIGLLNSAVGAYYYLRIIAILYMSKPEGQVALPQPASYQIGLVISATLVIVLGIVPDNLLRLIASAMP